MAVIARIPANCDRRILNHGVAVALMAAMCSASACFFTPQHLNTTAASLDPALIRWHVCATVERPECRSRYTAPRVIKEETCRIPIPR